MHPVVYFIFFFLAVGAAGMAWGSRHAAPAVKRERWLKYFMYILITGVVVLGIFFHFIQWVAMIIVAGGATELVRANFAKPGQPAGSSVISYLLYAGVATGFILFTVKYDHSFLIYIYFQVMVFDGFSQITGQIAGNHPLAPAISPAKTWEGFIGGMFFSIAVAMASCSWIGIGAAQGAWYGLLTGLAGFTGDMLASYYKRRTGIKDYSNWLPGQGGFLDRFDSFLVAGATYFLLGSTIFNDVFRTFTK